MKQTLSVPLSAAQVLAGGAIPKGQSFPGVGWGNPVAKPAVARTKLTATVASSVAPVQPAQYKPAPPDNPDPTASAASALLGLQKEVS